MKKLVGNNVVCVGDFCGPDIEEGTFHEQETVTDISHRNKVTQKCPCPPLECHDEDISDDSSKDNGKEQ